MCAEVTDDNEEFREHFEDYGHEGFCVHTRDLDAPEDTLKGFG